LIPNKYQGCLFCDIPSDRVILENAFAYAIRDGFPVTPLHTLIIPKRHVEDYFGIDANEHVAMNQLIHQLRTSILESDKDVQGFNIGMNIGAVAGQTIFHAHVHLIPRRIGDVANPRGGIRHIIPDKGHY
jgi:diadenosine tetraphosphate (Ap4A) HIT family hydrolase